MHTMHTFTYTRSVSQMFHLHAWTSATKEVTLTSSRPQPKDAGCLAIAWQLSYSGNYSDQHYDFYQRNLQQAIGFLTYIYILLVPVSKHVKSTPSVSPMLTISCSLAAASRQTKNYTRQDCSVAWSSSSSFTTSQDHEVVPVTSSDQRQVPRER